MNSYKVIFLDIDGVINSVQYEIWNHNHKHRYGLVDPREIHRLVRFIDKYNIKLVISSSWRNGNSYKDCIDELLKDSKRHHDLDLLIPYIIGVTPYHNSRHRGTEIGIFIDVLYDYNCENSNKMQSYYPIYKEHFEIEKYVIVDDDNDMLDEQMKNLIQTNAWTGLTKKDYRKIKKILQL